MPDPLSAADIAEGRHLLAALGEGERLVVRDRALWLDHGDGNADGITGVLPVWADSVAALIVWATNSAPALLDAAEKLNRVHAALANHPRVCDVHPDDDVISCGWKSVVAGVQWAINPEENR